MKSILLFRHAKAESPLGCPDIERPLAEKGAKDAKRMGKFLREADIQPDIIFSSKAKRSLETAKIAVEYMKISNEKLLSNSLLYTAETSDLLAFIENIDEKFNSVMIVGHNPTFESCASELIDGAKFEMPTGSVVCFESEFASWRDFRKNCIMRFFITPKLVKKLI